MWCCEICPWLWFKQYICHIYIYMASCIVSTLQKITQVAEAKVSKAVFASEWLVKLVKDTIHSVQNAFFSNMIACAHKGMALKWLSDTFDDKLKTQVISRDIITTNWGHVFIGFLSSLTWSGTIAGKHEGYGLRPVNQRPCVVVLVNEHGFWRWVS